MAQGLIKCKVLKEKQQAPDLLLMFFRARLDTEISLCPDSPTYPQETGKSPSQMVERMELAPTAWSLTVLQVSSGKRGDKGTARAGEASNQALQQCRDGNS